MVLLYEMSQTTQRKSVMETAIHMFNTTMFVAIHNFALCSRDSFTILMCPTFSFFV